jgi:hypothetical protein
MAVFLILINMAIVYWVLSGGLTTGLSSGETHQAFPQKEYESVVFPESPKQAFSKIVEATENATELPDGTVLSVRKVRQWH